MIIAHPAVRERLSSSYSTNPATTKHVHFVPTPPLAASHRNNMAAIGGPYPPPPPGPPPGYSQQQQQQQPQPPAPAGSKYIPAPYNPQQQQQQQQNERDRGLADNYFLTHPQSPYQPQQPQLQHQPAPYPPPPPLPAPAAPMPPQQYHHPQQQLIPHPQQYHGPPSPGGPQQRPPSSSPRPPRRRHSTSPRPASRGQRLGAAAAGAIATTVLDKYLIEGHLDRHGHHHKGRKDEHGEHHTIRRLADVAIGAYAGSEAFKQYEKHRSSSFNNGTPAKPAKEYYGESHNDLLHGGRRSRKDRDRDRGLAGDYLSPPASPYHASYWNNSQATVDGFDAEQRGRARSYDPSRDDRYHHRGRNHDGYYSDDSYTSRSRSRSRGGKRNSLKKDLVEAGIAALVGQQAGKLAHHGKDRSPAKHAAEGALVFGVAKELLGRRLRSSSRGASGRRR